MGFNLYCQVLIEQEAGSIYLETGFGGSDWIKSCHYVVLMIKLLVVFKKNDVWTEIYRHMLFVSSMWSLVPLCHLLSRNPSFGADVDLTPSQWWISTTCTFYFAKFALSCYCQQKMSSKVQFICAILRKPLWKMSEFSHIFLLESQKQAGWVYTSHYASEVWWACYWASLWGSKALWLLYGKFDLVYNKFLHICSILFHWWQWSY